MKSIKDFFNRILSTYKNPFQKGICMECKKKKAVYKPLGLCIDDLRLGYNEGKIEMSKRKIDEINSMYREYLYYPLLLVFEKKLFFQFLFLFAFLEITFFVKDRIDYFLDNSLN